MEKKFLLKYSEHKDQGACESEDCAHGPYDCYIRNANHFEPEIVYALDPRAKVHGSFVDLDDYKCDDPSPDLPTTFPSKLHLVVVRYSDGGTFSTTTGYWSIQRVTTSLKDAMSVVEKIETNNWGGDRWLPWNGYFSGLESVDVHTLDVVE